MSRVLKVVGTIAGVVAISLAIPGVGTALGLSAAGATTVAAAAGAVSAIAMAGAQALAKRPPAQGSVTQITIDTNSATPCILGRSYFGGVLRHDVGYGGKVGKVQNPYRSMVIVYSIGIVQALVAQYADFLPVSFSGGAATGYYAGFMYADSQVGASPESSALSPQWGSMPGWGSSYKLSGKAAILWGLRFDKDGKIFTSGVPQLGAVWDGVMAYDPTQDSTRPGGSGSHRIDDESTWEYSENPRDHALSYIYGRWKWVTEEYDPIEMEFVELETPYWRKVFGIGLKEDAIDIAAFTAWGNVCEANGWKVGGVIFEPGDRWANLKRIMAAGSAEPIFAGGVLSVKYDAPRVSLVTITPDDYSDGAYRTKGMQTWRDRINTIVPKYRSADHKWEYVESDAVTDAGYLAEDGEEKIDTYQIDLCQDKDQAAQLATYKLVNGREMFPIERNLKPEFRFYRPGDMVTIDDPEGGLNEQDCVIVRRSVDPQTLAVRWVLMSETADKHDFALGVTGTAPPTPTLLDPADRDDVAGVNASPPGYNLTLIQTSYISGVAGITLTSSDVGATANIVVASHSRVYPDKTVTVTGGTVGTSFAFGTNYWVYYDDEDRVGGAVTFVATTDPAVAAASESSPNRHFVGFVITATDGGGDTGGGGGAPPGWNNDNPIP